MPMNCKYCNGVFCCEHYSIQNHQCKDIEKDFVKVIECPFCLQMIKMNPTLTPEGNLSIHEATECKGISKPK